MENKKKIIIDFLETLSLEEVKKEQENIIDIIKGKLNDDTSTGEITKILIDIAADKRKIIDDQLKNIGLR